MELPQISIRLVRESFGWDVQGEPNNPWESIS